MTAGQQVEAIEYSLGGLRTFQIMEVMEKHYGGYDKTGFVKRDLYNFFARYKTKRIRSRDAQYLLNHMKAQADDDADFFYRYSVDNIGRLKNIFWADSQSRFDYEAFGDVVIFDSTYRVNRYNLPFIPFIGVNHHRSTVVFGCAILSSETVSSYVWLLHVFLEAARRKHPASLITDGDSAMRKAIEKIMPLSDHRLCSWHIEQNMVRNLRNPMLEEFRKFIYHPMDIDEFENRWVEFKLKNEISEDNQWFNMMYKLRKKWSGAYTKGKHFLGMLSNQRSESLNSRLHKHLDRKMSLVDLLEHYEFCISRIRRNEAELDAKASQSVSFTADSAELLEKCAAIVYTPTIFKKVRQQVREMSAWEIELLTDEGETFTYKTSLTSNVMKRYRVSCILDGKGIAGMSCECRKMECEYIPCTHIFALIKHLGGHSIPPCCVNDRWTMQAKAAYKTDSNAGTFSVQNRWPIIDNFATKQLKLYSGLLKTLIYVKG